MKGGLLSPDKVAISFFASVEKEVTKLYRKAHQQDQPTSQQQQFQLLRKVLIDFLKGKPYHGYNKENQPHTANLLERRETTLTLMHMQEKLMDKDEKLQRMGLRTELQFQLTRKFLGEFMKDMQQVPVLKSEHVALAEPTIDFKRRDSELLVRNRYLTESSEPQHSQITERESLPTDSLFTTREKQNKTLAKLNKLEKFLLRMPADGRHKKENGNTTWNFSPTKADYKLENETLKVVQEHLRCRLSDPTLLSDPRERKEESLRVRQLRLTKQEEELFRKEMLLNQKHAQLIKKEKQLKRVAA